ncbi:hypothetical protein T265_04490 [Opisthorchis viverrini]|uniref:Uncharacterized protein n=1 Tax=Opisthorchis viverrini TaxID=6198 RepID=A0A074ZSA9_OPIVI|nr:hypothetical protein T265_04490 [Opisthorchis viverrini]KER28697.1 hypothetical protein T265_04490 [Opisthorchis viverrini]
MPTESVAVFVARVKTFLFMSPHSGLIQYCLKTTLLFSASFEYFRVQAASFHTMQHLAMFTMLDFDPETERKLLR